MKGDVAQKCYRICVSETPNHLESQLFVVGRILLFIFAYLRDNLRLRQNPFDVG